MPYKELRILFQDDSADKISWVIFENGQLLSGPQQGTLTDLPVIDAKVDVVVYVPTANVTMINLTLPDMPQTQRAQAALYAIEEQLAEDVQELHAVVWEQAEKHLYSMAIIRKSLLQDWLNKLQAINIFPSAIFPDIVTIPAADDEWAVVTHGELIYVKIAQEMGFAIEGDYIQSILANSLLLSKNPPKKIKVYDNKEKILSLLFNDLSVPIYSVIEDEQNDSRFFWINFNYQGLHCNLLQGEMLPQESLMEKYQYWHKPMVLAVILIGLIACTTAVKWFYLNHEETLLNQQIASIYMQLFPEATTVVSPKERIEQLLSTKNSLAQGNDFFDLLGLSGQVLNQIPQVKLQNISFMGKQLVLQVQVDNASSLTKLNDTLKKYRINVQQGETTSTGSTITAKFTITRQTS